MKGHFFLISLLAISENLGLKKLCRHDSSWHVTHFLFRFAVNVKGLRLPAWGGGWTSNEIFKKRGYLAEPQLFRSDFQLMSRAYTVCNPPLFLLGGGGRGWSWVGVELPTKFSKRTSPFREGWWERGDDLFQGDDAVFTHTKK